MAKTPKKPESTGTMIDDTSPIGSNGAGGLVVVDKDDPPWKPTVVDADGNEVDPDEIEDDAPEDE